MTPLWNEAFGWLWLALGMTFGVWMGLRFRDDAWLGGYGSWPRRMIRLGHIAMIALGAFNILFATSAPRIAFGAPWPLIASAAWIAGALLMPAVCFISAHDKRHARWFALPVIALLLGATITWTGLLASALSASSTGGAP